jgi:7-carboxy-7-deazaguanine synthase
VLLEERAIGRRPVDVTLVDFNALLLQKTSGVAAGRSRGLPVEDGLRHATIVRRERGESEGEAPRLKYQVVLTINEIFQSIQGESTHAGRPCVFVRLTACDLRCSWCDTPYAFHEGRRMSVDEVIAQVRSYDCSLVEITGGEPLLQKEVYPLMQRLVDDGFSVMLETGGHRSIADVPAAVVRVMDVKCPGSGESDRNDWTNMNHLGRRDEVKFVINDRTDYDFARQVITAHNLVDRVGAVLLSPVHGGLDPKQLAAWILADRLPVRLQLQLHKYIWDAQTRGV